MKTPILGFLALLALAAGGMAATNTTFVPTITAVGKDSITVKKGVHTGLKVSSVDSDGAMNPGAPANAAKYSITKFTTINVDGLPGTIKDLTVGMRVDVRASTDPTVAEGIVANTIPPIRVDDTSKDKFRKNKVPVKRIAKSILGDAVIAISKDRITFGESGASKARAYLIGPSTSITLNGAKATVSDIQPSMPVKVNTSDGTTATTIDAQDVK